MFFNRGLHRQNLEPVTKRHRNTIEFKALYFKSLDGLGILYIKSIGQISEIQASFNQNGQDISPF